MDFSYLEPIDWRIEKKFFLNNLETKAIELVIKVNPFLFSEIFNQRFVNSLYLDTYELSSYHDNVDGNSKRFKVRVRWYGNLFGLIEKPVLELKIKDGMVGTKISYPLPPFRIERGFSLNNLLSTIWKAIIPERLKHDLSLFQFSLLNRYSRKYYLSADSIFRITLDSGLVFYRLFQNNNNFLNHIDDGSNILELKYDSSDSTYDESVTNCFNFRVTKSSKYIYGLESVLLLHKSYD
jgi:hypothetical protein